MTRNPFDHVELFGVRLDAVTIQQAIGYIIERATPPDAPAGYVVKPYVEFLDRGAEDEAVRSLINGAELSLPDGIAGLWAAHYLYAGPRSNVRFFKTLAQIVLQPKHLAWPLPERIAGVNFTLPLLETAADHNLRVYLLGRGSQADIDQTAEVLRKRYPKLTIVGTHDGRDIGCPPGQVSEAWLNLTTAAIRTAAPDLTLVGMGFPLQERVCAALVDRIGHGMFVGEGGTFDFEAFGGPHRKAPAAFQRLGLEWLWRLILQPNRLVRQLSVPRYLIKVWRRR